MAISVPGKEFDSFLFAPIGEERDGMLLSVLSALARLGVDPWQEAAKLARLPGEAATVQLASLIAALPDRPSSDPPPGATAARLVALLPRQPDVLPREAAVGDRVEHVRMLMFVAAMVVMVGAQIFMASRQAASPVQPSAAGRSESSIEPSAQVEHGRAAAPTPASETSPAQAGPASRTRP